MNAHDGMIHGDRGEVVLSNGLEVKVEVEVELEEEVVGGVDVGTSVMPIEFSILKN